MRSSGYSGTPLAKKLGIKDGFKISIINEPDHYFSLFEDMPVDDALKIEQVEIISTEMEHA